MRNFILKVIFIDTGNAYSRECFSFVKMEIRNGLYIRGKYGVFVPSDFSITCIGYFRSKCNYETGI